MYIDYYSSTASIKNWEGSQNFSLSVIVSDTNFLVSSYFGFRNFSPASTGTHALIIDNFNVTQIILGTTNFALDSQFSVFPNPTKNILNVTNSINASIQNIELSDLNGRVVKNVNFTNGNETQINISDISQGVYLMKIISSQGTLVKKVIKE